MSEPTDKQISFIKTLVSERRQALTPAPPWLTRPTTSKEASDLIGRLKTLATDPPTLTPEQQAAHELIKDKVEALRLKLPAMSMSNHQFAKSLIDQFDRKGSLSDKQVNAIEAMMHKPDEGFYLQDTGEVVMAYTTRAKHLSSKTWMPDTNDWAYTGMSGLARCTADRKMTGDQIAALGRTLSKDGTGMCVICLAEGRDPTLTEPRSIAAGYGATCAAHYGLPYPTKDEADAILKERA